MQHYLVFHSVFKYLRRDANSNITLAHLSKSKSKWLSEESITSTLHNSLVAGMIFSGTKYEGELEVI